MLGALVPGREGGLLNARLRYFDPVRKRAGVPEDVAALVSELGDRRTVVTLVNVNPTTARTVVVQAGGYAEHQFESVDGERANRAGRRAATSPCSSRRAPARRSRWRCAATPTRRPSRSPGTASAYRSRRSRMRWPV